MKKEQFISKDILKLIGKRCYDLRRNYKEERVISQRGFATELGLVHSAISNIENGFKEMTMKELLAYQRYCNVSFDYLLGRSECKEADNEEIHKRIGLSPESIEKLEEVRNTDVLKILSDFITSGDAFMFAMFMVELECIRKLPESNKEYEEFIIQRRLIKRINETFESYFLSKMSEEERKDHFHNVARKLGIIQDKDGEYNATQD